MINRKKGETHGQYNKRLESELRNVIAGNQKVMTMLSDENKINPRTYKLYKQEAELMFAAIVLAEHALRTDQLEYAKEFLQSAIGSMNFTPVDIYDNSLAANPGKYNA